MALLGVAVSGLCPKGVLQRSVLGAELFNISASNTDSGTECILSKFVENTKLYGPVDRREELLPTGAETGLRGGPKAAS